MRGKAFSGFHGRSLRGGAVEVNQQQRNGARKTRLMQLIQKAFNRAIYITASDDFGVPTT